MATGQLSLFESRLPRRPYCTNDPATGMRVRPQSFAVTQRFIQPNPPASIGYLVFDIDRANAAFAYERHNLPVPSITAINPANGHAHLSYALTTPVIKTDMGRRKPLLFLAALQKAMTTQLGADPGYMMVITKNPLHPAWKVIDHSGAVYDLQELAEYVDLTQRQKTPPRAEISGLGRNCSLFEKLRIKAYRKVGDFKAGGSVETWHAYILEAARELNAYSTPLLDSEVRAIAKSVSKWTWRHFGTGKAAHDKFIERQRVRQKRMAQAVRGATSAKVVQAVQGLQRNGSKVTVAAVAQLVGMTRQAIAKDYRRLLDTFPMLDSGNPPAQDWKLGSLDLGIPEPATRDERIVHMRSRGYSQMDIARRLRISQQTVSRVLIAALPGRKGGVGENVNSAKSDNSAFCLVV